MDRKTALVTGSSGFIGYHLCKRLLADGWTVIGIDCLSDYYDVALKERRQSGLLQSDGFRTVTERIETPGVIHDLMDEHRPDALIHLAAQAGVRYSIDIPKATSRPTSSAPSAPRGDARLPARAQPAGLHLLGLRRQHTMPYAETAKADTQMSFYAATKKATEAMAHSYAHLYDLPTTMFRFFTVYGPWGRPDMAPYKFTRAILAGRPSTSTTTVR
jgi:UDP-glucuronate 4-epimerase